MYGSVSVTWDLGSNETWAVGPLKITLQMKKLISKYLYLYQVVPSSVTLSRSHRAVAVSTGRCWAAPVTCLRPVDAWLTSRRCRSVTELFSVLYKSLSPFTPQKLHTLLGHASTVSSDYRNLLKDQRRSFLINCITWYSMQRRYSIEFTFFSAYLLI